MTNKDAAARIREHNRIHQKKEPRAVFITEALEMAAALLERTPDMQPYSLDDAMSYVLRNGRKGRPLWVEVKNDSGGCGWMPCEKIVAYAFSTGKYGKENTRFWPERPTPEQSAAWSWEEING